MCLAVEPYGRAWEIRGVVTSPSHRRLGLDHVSSELAKLARRGLLAGYQVGEDNQPSSKQLARSIRMTQLLTLTYMLTLGDGAPHVTRRVRGSKPRIKDDWRC